MVLQYLLLFLATVTATFTWDHSGNSNAIRLYTGIIKDCKNANDCVSSKASFFFFLHLFLIFLSTLLFSSLLTDIVCSRRKSKFVYHFFISTVRTCGFSTISHLQVSNRLHKHCKMERNERYWLSGLQAYLSVQLLYDGKLVWFQE